MIMPRGNTKTVQVQALKSFASPLVDGMATGYQPGLKYQLPEDLARTWAKAGLVEILDEPPDVVRKETSGDATTKKNEATAK